MSDNCKNKDCIRYPQSRKSFTMFNVRIILLVKRILNSIKIIIQKFFTLNFKRIVNTDIVRYIIVHISTKYIYTNSIYLYN